MDQYSIKTWEVMVIETYCALRDELADEPKSLERRSYLGYMLRSIRAQARPYHSALSRRISEVEGRKDWNKW